jgi:hypothetical protein
VHCYNHLYVQSLKWSSQLHWWNQRHTIVIVATDILGGPTGLAVSILPSNFGSSPCSLTNIITPINGNPGNGDPAYGQRCPGLWTGPGNGPHGETVPSVGAGQGSGVFSVRELRSFFLGEYRGGGLSPTGRVFFNYPCKWDHSFT